MRTAVDPEDNIAGILPSLSISGVQNLVQNFDGVKLVVEQSLNHFTPTVLSDGEETLEIEAQPSNRRKTRPRPWSDAEAERASAEHLKGRCN